MLAETWELVQEIFTIGLHMDSVGRAELLESCDSKIAVSVRELWDAHDRAGEFLQAPVVSTDWTADSPDDPPANIQQIGPYRVLRELGRGGMGAVYLGARADGQFDQQVAIKLIKKGLDTDEIVRRFRAERQILAGLVHPGIARLLDGGATADGRPYLVLEVVEGDSIETWCTRHALSPRAKIALFRKICAAVSYAHRNLVIHRDIKPSNILVTGDGDPKLLDFGVARVLDARDQLVTDAGRVVCTPAYASPEQLQGNASSTASDVYSLGVVLYELLAGRRPDIASAPPNSVIRAQKPRRWWRLLSTGSVADRDLDNIFKKALCREPDGRYATVDQFSSDLERYLDNEPVIACGASRRYRFQKFVLRHKLSVAAGVAVALGLSVTTIWAIGQTRIARFERRLADQRFRETRQLANTLLFRLYGEVSVLPGATHAREDIVREALKYLDGVAGAPGSDPELRYEIATGYRRLASIQGDPFNASKGDRSAALSSIQKALKLQESIAAEYPAYVPARWFLGVLLDDESRLLPDAVAARAVSQRSLAIMQRNLHDQPTRENRMQVAIAFLHLAGFDLSYEKMSVAQAELQRSIEIFHQLSSEGFSNVPLRTQHAFAHKRMGALLSVFRGDYDSAAVHYGEALAIDRQLSTEFPRRADLRFNLSFTEHDLAVVDLHLDRLNDAGGLLQDVLAIRKAMLEADPLDTRAAQGFEDACITMSDLLRTTKRFPEAIAYARQSIDIINRNGPPNLVSFGRAAAVVRLADAHYAWAKEKPEEANEHLASAERYYESAKSIFGSLDRNALSEADRQTPQTIDRELAEVIAMRFHRRVAASK